jgi:hypothetical protein
VTRGLLLWPSFHQIDLHQDCTQGNIRALTCSPESARDRLACGDSECGPSDGQSGSGPWNERQARRSRCWFVSLFAQTRRPFSPMELWRPKSPFYPASLWEPESPFSPMRLWELESLVNPTQLWELASVMESMTPGARMKISKRMMAKSNPAERPAWERLQLQGSTVSQGCGLAIHRQRRLP